MKGEENDIHPPTHCSYNIPYPVLRCCFTTTCFNGLSKDHLLAGTFFFFLFLFFSQQLWKPRRPLNSLISLVLIRLFNPISNEDASVSATLLTRSLHSGILKRFLDGHSQGENQYRDNVCWGVRFVASAMDAWCRQGWLQMI